MGGFDFPDELLPRALISSWLELWFFWLFWLGRMKLMEELVDYVKLFLGLEWLWELRSLLLAMT